MQEPTNYMQRAIDLARQAEEAGEVPVGAVVVMDGAVIGEGWNRPISTHDPSAHAEIVAIREAASGMANYRLTNAELYTTLEPCVMCAGAIIHARIATVYYGAMDPRAGAAGSVFSILGTDKLNHEVEVQGGIMQDECARLLKDFFKRKR